MITFEPIGIIHTPFTQPQGTPIQPAAADGAEGTVEVYEQYLEALADLDRFDRIWLLYHIDRSGPVKMKVIPFLDTVERGLFATRAPSRPNPIGLSPVKLVKIEHNIIHIRDVDILDNTPLLDIKPYSRRFDIFPDTNDGWLAHANPDTPKSDNRFNK